jgi:hypothetical protein
MPVLLDVYFQGSAVCQYDVPFRSIISSVGSPCYAIVDFLHKILTSLVGNTDSFVKNFEHFVHLIKGIILQN